MRPPVVLVALGLLLAGCGAGSEVGSVDTDPWTRFLAEVGPDYSPDSVKSIVEANGPAFGSSARLDSIDCELPPCIVRVVMTGFTAPTMGGPELRYAPVFEEMRSALNTNPVGLHFRFFGQHDSDTESSRYALWAMPRQRLSEELLAVLEEGMVRRLGQPAQPGSTWLQPKPLKER